MTFLHPVSSNHHNNRKGLWSYSSKHHLEVKGFLFLNFVFCSFLLSKTLSKATSSTLKPGSKSQSTTTHSVRMLLLISNCLLCLSRSTGYCDTKIPWLIGVFLKQTIIRCLEQTYNVQLRNQICHCKIMFLTLGFNSNVKTGCRKV